MKPLTFISLFAGIGGFDLAFERAGFQPVAQVEINDAARSVLAHHWPGVSQFADVRAVGKHNLPAADIVCGGFPCQDLSVAGRRTGLVGERSGLFYEMVRITDELRPAFLIWENVPGLLSSDRGRDFGRVLNALDTIGYSGAWTVLDAQFFGVAQRRQRVFGVFTRLSIGAAGCAEILSLANRLPWNTQTRRTTRAGVAVNAATNTSGSGRNHPGLAAAFDPRNITSNVNRTRVEFGLPANTLHQDGLSVVTSAAIAQSNRGNDTGDIAETLRADSNGALPMVAAALTAHGRRNDFESETFFSVRTDQTKSNGLGLNQNIAQTLDQGNGQAIAGTIGAAHGRNRGLGQENEIDLLAPSTFGVRRLTPTECERLQGFPDGWTEGQADSARYRQLGNAVAVPVVEWIARRIAATEAV